jgi:membrane-associated phospholipid phosphatase
MMTVLPIKMLPRAGVAFLVVLLATYYALFPEESIQNACAHFFSDYLNAIFQVTAHLLMFFAAWRKRSWQPVMLDLSVTALVTAVVQVSKKNLIADIAIRPSSGYEGFPSGHASASFSLAFLLSLYYPRLSWFWYGEAALITWSRIQANAHTELQVVAGMIFGTAVAYGIANLFWREKSSRNEYVNCYHYAKELLKLKRIEKNRE